MNPIAIATPTLSQPPDPQSGGAEREPLFTARGLTKIYPSGETEIRALDGLDLDLYRGELIENGGDRLTVLHILRVLGARPTIGLARPFAELRAAKGEVWFQAEFPACAAGVAVPKKSALIIRLRESLRRT